MNKENYSEDKCYVKKVGWIVSSTESEIDVPPIAPSSCENIGCTRGLVDKGNIIYASGTCLMALIASINRPGANEIVIKPNPKYL